MGRVHAVIDQEPRLGQDQADIELADIVQDDVGTCSFEGCAPVRPIYPHDQTESPRPCCLDAGGCIINHGRPCRRHPDFPRGIEQGRRIRFPRQLQLRGRGPVHDQIKDIQQPHPLKNPRALRLGVARTSGTPPARSRLSR
jgi:hypothetical protein